MGLTEHAPSTSSPGPAHGCLGPPLCTLQRAEGSTCLPCWMVRTLCALCQSCWLRLMPALSCFHITGGGTAAHPGLTLGSCRGKVEGTVEALKGQASVQLPPLQLTVLCLVNQSCPTLWDPMDCSLPGSSVHGDSPGKNTGVGCHALLQGIFPTQGLNPGLLHYRQILYSLSHQGSPRILEWVAYPLSRKTSGPRN